MLEDEELTRYVRVGPGRQLVLVLGGHPIDTAERLRPVLAGRPERSVALLLAVSGADEYEPHQLAPLLDVVLEPQVSSVFTWGGPTARLEDLVDETLGGDASRPTPPVVTTTVRGGIAEAVDDAWRASGTLGTPTVVAAIVDMGEPAVEVVEGWAARGCRLWYDV